MQPLQLSPPRPSTPPDNCTRPPISHSDAECGRVTTGCTVRYDNSTRQEPSLHHLSVDLTFRVPFRHLGAQLGRHRALVGLSEGLTW